MPYLEGGHERELALLDGKICKSSISSLVRTERLGDLSISSFVFLPSPLFIKAAVYERRSCRGWGRRDNWFIECGTSCSDVCWSADRFILWRGLLHRDILRLHGAVCESMGGWWTFSINIIRDGLLFLKTCWVVVLLHSNIHGVFCQIVACHLLLCVHELCLAWLAIQFFRLELQVRVLK